MSLMDRARRLLQMPAMALFAAPSGAAWRIADSADRRRNPRLMLPPEDAWRVIEALGLSADATGARWQLARGDGPERDKPALATPLRPPERLADLPVEAAQGIERFLRAWEAAGLDRGAPGAPLRPEGKITGGPAPRNNALALAADRRAALQRGLGRLGAARSQILIERFVIGMTLRDIAQRRGFTLEAAYSALLLAAYAARAAFAREIGSHRF